jgi:hypothetical protein
MWCTQGHGNQCWHLIGPDPNHHNQLETGLAHSHILPSRATLCLPRAMWRSTSSFKYFYNRMTSLLMGLDEWEWQDDEVSSLVRQACVIDPRSYVLFFFSYFF